MSSCAMLILQEPLLERLFLELQRRKGQTPSMRRAVDLEYS
jgi:hypothetical protein